MWSGGGQQLVSIWFSQKHPDTWIHIGSSYLCWKIAKYLGDGLRVLCVSYTGNIFPTETTFRLWHCWRCAICKHKSENSHSRGDRLGRRRDESGAPTESDMGQRGIRLWPHGWGNDWVQRRGREGGWGGVSWMTPNETTRDCSCPKTRALTLRWAHPPTKISGQMLHNRTAPLLRHRAVFVVRTLGIGYIIFFLKVI